MPFLAPDLSASVYGGRVALAEMAGRLGKTTLHARQISPRGGDLFCELRGDRVEIAGHAVKYLEGVIEV